MVAERFISDSVEGSDVSLQVSNSLKTGGGWAWLVAWIGGGPPGHSALMPLTLPLVPIRTAGHTVTQGRVP